MPIPNTFSKQERLTSRKDFDSIFSRRCSVSDARIILFGQCNERAISRVGFGVSRKVGSAARRNRFRRIYREAYRLIKRELPTGLDLVIVPRNAIEPRLHEVQESLRKLMPLLARKFTR